MSEVLIIRFTALGDVAMCVPVIFALAQKYPEQKFVFVTTPFFEPLRAYFPKNIELLTVDVHKDYKGLWGLYRLYQLLKKRPISAIADLHHVLRSRILRAFFIGKNLKMAFIDKGRKEKKILTRKNNKRLFALPSGFERYQKVFKNLGFDFELNYTPFLKNTAKQQEKILGIAPFSQHQGKTYPLEKMDAVIRHFYAQNIQIYLLGAQSDRRKIEVLCARYPKMQVLLGQPLDQVLEKIAQMQVLLTMDSANMHFAALVGTPALTIWGATHPYLGFGGFRQPQENHLQVPIYCSPCSTFGQKPCFRKDYACLNELHSEKIIERLQPYFAKQT